MSNEDRGMNADDWYMAHRRDGTLRKKRGAYDVMGKSRGQPNIESLREKLTRIPDRKHKGHFRAGDGETKRGRSLSSHFTPSEILFEMQMQARGFIEVDIALRTSEPFLLAKTVVGQPTRIKGLEPGEIMKLKRDLEGFLIWWRGQLALERADSELEKRVEIKGEEVEGV